MAALFLWANNPKEIKYPYRGATMYGVTVEILAPNSSWSRAMKRAPHSFLTPSPRGNVVIVRDVTYPISKRKFLLWWRAQVIRGPVSRPGHADFPIFQRTSGT